MNLFFTIEASQPNGVAFRMAFGCNLLPLASLVAILLRLI